MYGYLSLSGSASAMADANAFGGLQSTMPAVSVCSWFFLTAYSSSTAVIVGNGVHSPAARPCLARRSREERANTHALRTRTRRPTRRSSAKKGNGEEDEAH